MSMTPGELYARLRALVGEMPDLANGPITPEKNQWLGRAIALVDLTDDMVNTAALQVAAQSLNTPSMRAYNA